ncbi:MAG: RidA family protein [Ramlibacter sp.]|nr:RidA family protein [Ramlibacter sp.]
MDSSRQAALNEVIAGLGYDFSGEIRIGGDYVPVVVDGRTAFVSGQVPRVGTEVVVTGPAGSTVSLQQAQQAAMICTVRALLLLRQSLGGLENIRRVLRVGVFVQSAPHFSQHSEVADAASGVLRKVLGDRGAHTRTSVGVMQLPKNATVEVEMTVGIEAANDL